jgi:hypothetical protein
MNSMVIGFFLEIIWTSNIILRLVTDSSVNPEFEINVKKSIDKTVGLTSASGLETGNVTSESEKYYLLFHF